MGTYSTQIFSLAVLLSSMFVYNQMGGIDEVALDCLTEMTRHIRVRASGGKASASKLGQFSPGFIWLPKPVQGGQKDVAAKNEESVFSQNQFHMLHYLFAHTQNFTLFTPNNDRA
uniref:Guanylate-binding protein N-terminal domain-containing protein n=1 Tax=Solanum lycopersicum TaxID=4081 RepID=A0A3Q7GJA1_SOLLC